MRGEPGLLARGQEATASRVLTVRDVSKAYGATIAVRSVSFDIERGEIHALVGENGAGKSTVVKILSGIVAPDHGTLELDGANFSPQGPMAARAGGVSAAFQELSLLPNLTVAENLMLPRQLKGDIGLVSRKRNWERAAAILAEYGLQHIHPGVLVRSLSLAEKQRVELTRALSRKLKLLVLDEPTAALADPGWLFEILVRVTAAGTGVLYISHRLSEVRKLCRRCTVLRNGESIETVPLAGVDNERIFEMMVGSVARPRKAAVQREVHLNAPVALSVKHLVGGNVADISLDVHRGEIVGVAGLEGQGQRDLFRMLAGLRTVRSGEILVDGRVASIDSPADAARSSISFVPEERKIEGIFLGLRTEANMTLTLVDKLSHFGILNRAREDEAATKGAQRVDLAERYLRLPISALSGGNQQKALIGRVLASGARNLVLFDPTRGVDVGAMREFG
jgi:ribose transport system ATP-binding protein